MLTILIASFVDFLIFKLRVECAEKLDYVF
jgi:hypothetical protein